MNQEASQDVLMQAFTSIPIEGAILIGAMLLLAIIFGRRVKTKSLPGYIEENYDGQ